MIDFKHPVVWIIGLFLVIGGFTLGDIVGRHQAPTRTVEVEKRVEIQKETQVVQQKIDTAEILKAIQDTVRHNDIHREVVTERRPDGTVVRHETTADTSTTEKKSETDASKTTTTTTEVKVWKETVRVEEHIKLVESLQARWAFEVGAGYALPTLWGSGPGFNLIPYPGVVADVAVSRHLFGPAWLGLYGQTTGVAGLRLRVQW